MKYDVIVIGGGSAGLMASIAASRQGAKVLLLDKGDKLGRKLGISGGGRCNVTNNKDMDELIQHIPGNGRFLYSALTQFGNKHIIEFFENLGIRLKEEDNGRMFPVSDKAKTVVDALIGQVRKQGVEIRTNSPVKRVLFQDGSVQGVQLHSGEKMDSRAVIIASGGCSVPHTGSTGDGYAWAEAGGHTITQLFPTEVPLTSKEAWIRGRELQGLSLRDVTLSVWNAKGKAVISHRGDMLFTHFGLSGPIALRCSQFVVKELAKTERKEVLLTVDLFPDLSMDELYKESMALTKAEAKKAIKNVLKPLLSERLIPMVLERSGLDEQLTHDNIPKQKWLDMCKLMKAFPVRIHGTLSIEEAFVTGGGVHLKEVDPSTMESKLVNGLYFCGEVLDIHGYTGGYNITAAFSTGYMAGQSAAQQ
ncbi:NAD(P)/FAD-dependent oxidoreductase [Paenibacillus sp. CGMCC 1.16610]|uniref:Aminoacetone oxidase family FAD-binding enzyme n=1 Tax=Paenibacillus anseongense TaxID=2682845 RepID=A0ABW9UG18_9BACL|nr:MULTISPECIES: NAD(P)/FAD-dependent oxidoreductase [Paenibacillus]MBA2942739.1 NAD(P)/FAD-dependent oxidoreductase [Paenibacillus sp. CGMCC 1.16610]MVQ38225.1 aminoacetone oxidase family FAD-binding enzyme [Paenibacillus anseongense]